MSNDTTICIFYKFLVEHDNKLSKQMCIKNVCIILSFWAPFLWGESNILKYKENRNKVFKVTALG